MRHDPSNQQAEINNHIRTLIEEHKREIRIFYSEMKLRIPSYLKDVKIKHLRAVGATVDPNGQINCPIGVEDRLIKFARLQEKIREIEQVHKEQVRQYYESIKKKLPKELLQKRVKDLSKDELSQLGFGVGLMKKHSD